MHARSYGPVVLVVEDDDEVCGLLVELMSMRGLGAVGVRTVHDGLALLRKGLRPRVVVLDPLTRDNGCRHLPELTTDPAWQPAPVILGVGAGGPRPPVEGLLRWYPLPKPLDLGELFEILDRYLGVPSEGWGRTEPGRPLGRVNAGPRPLV